MPHRSRRKAIPTSWLGILALLVQILLPMAQVAQAAEQARTVGLEGAAFICTASGITLIDPSSGKPVAPTRQGAEHCPFCHFQVAGMDVLAPEVEGTPCFPSVGGADLLPLTPPVPEGVRHRGQHARAPPVFA